MEPIELAQKIAQALEAKFPRHVAVVTRHADENHPEITPVIEVGFYPRGTSASQRKAVAYSEAWFAHDGISRNDKAKLIYSELNILLGFGGAR